MAPSTILVLLAQAWIAWCFRLDSTEKREISHQEELSQSTPPFGEGGDAPPAVELAKVSAPDYVAVQKQVEWYLGDENLHHDKFFHDKISSDPEGWLEVKFILTCNRVKAMGATTEEDVLAALKGSDKVEVKKGEDGAFIRRPTNAPLPKWEPKPKNYAYDSGIIVVFNNVLAQQTSSIIKDALKTALPLTAKLWFVSDVDDKQRCFCAIAPFDGDREFIESLTLVVGGAKLKPELCKGDLLEVGLQLLATQVIEKREKGAQVRKENGPIIVGTPRFVNVGALRAVSREKETISTRFNGKQSDYNLIKAAHRDPVSTLERVHSILYDKVTLATQAVAQLNTSFASADVVKKIVRYMYHSAKREELHEVPIEEACAELVKFAMNSYEVRFGEREWFFKLDLAPAFTAAAWELLRGKSGVTFEQVKVAIRNAFEEFLDSAMLNKGLWEATRNTFPDAAVHKKVYLAVQKTHTPAFEATIAEAKPEQALGRVQSFLGRWINDSMTRAWNSVVDAEEVLNVSSVINLFQNMLSPFGPDDPFSTIPSLLTEELGPLPKNWTFVNHEVNALFKSWGRRTGVKEDQPMKKSKKMKVSAMKVGDEAILHVKFGTWKGDHSVKLLEKEEEGWKVSHDEDGYVCVIKWKDIESGKLAFLKVATKGNRTKTTQVNKTAAEEVSEEPADEEATTQEVAVNEDAEMPVQQKDEETVALEKASAKKAAAEKKAAAKKATQEKAAAEKATKGEAVQKPSTENAVADNAAAEKAVEEEGKISAVVEPSEVAAAKKASREMAAAEKAEARKAAKESSKAAKEKTEAWKASGKASKESTSASRGTTEEVVEKPVEEEAATEGAMPQKAGEEKVDTSTSKKPADEKAAAERAAARLMAKEKAAAKRAAWKEKVSAEKAAKEKASLDKAAAVEKEAVSEKSAEEVVTTQEVAVNEAAEMPLHQKDEETVAVQKAPVKKTAAEKPSAAKKAAKDKAAAEKATKGEAVQKPGTGSAAADNAAAEKAGEEESKISAVVKPSRKSASKKAAMEGAAAEKAEARKAAKETRQAAKEKASAMKALSEETLVEGVNQTAGAKKEVEAKNPADEKDAEDRAAAKMAAKETTAALKAALKDKVAAKNAAAKEKASAGDAQKEDAAAKSEGKGPAKKGASKKEMWKERVAAKIAARRAARENAFAGKASSEQAVAKPNKEAVGVGKSVAKKAAEEEATTSPAENLADEKAAATTAARGKVVAEKAEASKAARKAAKEMKSVGKAAGEYEAATQNAAKKAAREKAAKEKTRVATEGAVEKPVEEKAAAEASEEKVETSASKKPADERAASEKAAARPVAKAKVAAKRAAWREKVAANKAATEKASVDKAAAAEEEAEHEHNPAEGDEDVEAAQQGPGR